MVGNRSEAGNRLWTVTCMPTSVTPMLCNPRLSIAFSYMQHIQLQVLAMLTRILHQFMSSISRREQASKRMHFFQLTTHPKLDGKQFEHRHSSRWTLHHDRSNVNNSRESRAGSLHFKHNLQIAPFLAAKYHSNREPPAKPNSPNMQSAWTRF